MRSHEYESSVEHAASAQFERDMEEARRQFPDIGLETNYLITDFQMTMESIPEIAEKISTYRDEHNGAEPPIINALFQRGGTDIHYVRANINGIRLLFVTLHTASKDESNIPSKLESIEIIHDPEHYVYATSFQRATRNIVDSVVHIDQGHEEQLTPSRPLKIKEGRDFLARVQSLISPLPVLDLNAPLDLPWAA